MYAAHQQLVKEQDENLSEINEVALRLQNHAKNINEELDKQTVLGKILEICKKFYS